LRGQQESIRENNIFTESQFKKSRWQQDSNKTYTKTTQEKYTQIMAVLLKRPIQKFLSHLRFLHLLT